MVQVCAVPRRCANMTHLIHSDLPSPSPFPQPPRDVPRCSADGDLDDDEYEESKEDTVEQLKEFQESLKTAADGDMSLVDSVGAMNLVRWCASHRLLHCAATLLLV